MKRLLMIRFSALGDVAMLAPVAKEVTEALPDVDVTVLSRPFCAPLFEGLGERVHFIGADIKGEYHGVKGLGRLFHRLDAMHFDYVADMHGVLRTHYLTLRFRLAGYPVAQINKRRSERRLLTAPEGRKVLWQLVTSFEKYRRVLRRVLPIGHVKHLEEYVRTKGLQGPVIPFTAIDGEVLSLLPAVPRRLIGIAPFAAHGGKILPVEKTERVIARLVERQGVMVYLFGGGGAEREMMERWQSRWPESVVMVAGRLGSLREELQLMSRLDVMMSMDSANMHLASLTGTRVVSIWGATHPYAGFLGWRQREEDCVQLPLACRPCSVFGKQPCRRGDFACMTGIDEEVIVGKLME